MNDQDCECGKTILYDPWDFMIVECSGCGRKYDIETEYDQDNYYFWLVEIAEAKK